jgi:RNA polymerase sigma-70 factor (ECF subfamily)
LDQQAPHIEQIIEDCRNGNRKAQFAVYKLYYKAMFNTAFRMVNDRFVAEDVLQESFLSAFTKLDTFSGDVTFGAWLKRIVINRSLTEIKKNQRINTLPLEKADVDQYEESNEDYTEVQAKEILEKINNLKQNYKIALTLHLIEGYNYEEIAQIMEISYENSRTTVSRAKNKLRTLLIH